MNNAMARRNGWNQQAQILECIYIYRFSTTSSSNSLVWFKCIWTVLNRIEVEEFKESKIVIGYDGRVLNHLLLLKAGLRAAPREGGSARCPCLICT